MERPPDSADAAPRGFVRLPFKKFSAAGNNPPLSSVL